MTVLILCRVMVALIALTTLGAVIASRPRRTVASMALLSVVVLWAALIVAGTVMVLA